MEFPNRQRIAPRGLLPQSFPMAVEAYGFPVKILEFTMVSRFAMMPLA